VNNQVNNQITSKQLNIKSIEPEVQAQMNAKPKNAKKTKYKAKKRCKTENYLSIYIEKTTF